MGSIYNCERVFTEENYFFEYYCVTLHLKIPVLFYFKFKSALSDKVSKCNCFLIWK